MAGHVVQPVSGSSWNMPGYTGFVQGLKETLGSTPVTAQYKAAAPALGEFLHTRRFVPPIPTPSRDPCNFPDSFKASGEQVNLWPSLQTTGKQGSCKPAQSCILLGDNRVLPFKTLYAADFAAPFAQDAKLRSPLRNKERREATDLPSFYKHAFNRVGEKRLNDTILHMKERIAGKIGNANNNAFKLRKLFAMTDTQKTGLIDVEDFRVVTESYGMQLDDDSILALFSRYDTDAIGAIHYHDLMKDLLDEDSYALFSDRR
ncbi:hypothetical protein WJX75_000165 [Coccomyxa subellipsoidea]|uniref:EF-hand domain-containing protein n=1 Tax=Coccomyxa subellipsoidea TaxID=248742 RepID=A0ABR2YV12_9CHLO